MNRQEVEETLSRYGDYRETEATFQGGTAVVGVIFNDPVIQRRLGGRSIVLIFEDGKYIKATIPVFLGDANKSICR